MNAQVSITMRNAIQNSHTIAGCLVELNIRTVLIVILIILRKLLPRTVVRQYSSTSDRQNAVSKVSVRKHRKYSLQLIAFRLAF